MSEQPKGAHSVRFEEAAEWYVRLQSPDVDDATWTTFALWLEADPANRLAYDAVEDADMAVEDAGPLESDDVQHPTLAQFARPVRRNVSPWIAGAAIAAAAAVLLVVMRGIPSEIKEYDTRFGETRSIALSDGSGIELNSNTKMRIREDAGARTVFLDRGEAYFRVIRDPGRPFVVHVGDQVVRDIGTVFDVVRADGITTVTVAEGRVDIGQVGASEPPLVLAAGDQFVRADGTSRPAVARIDPEEALSWRQGYLVYSNAPLSNVVRDLNRYFAVPISISGPDVGNQRFSGVLKLDDENAVLRRICGFLPVTTQRDANGKITLHMAMRGH